MKGYFITVEGPDGAGKTSVINELKPILEQALSVPLVLTREPGGIPIAEKIRDIILNPKHIEMDDRTEALLYAAARRQHLIQKVLPAVEQGKLVLCDRFVDSSLAYQGAGRKIGMDEVAAINKFAIEDVKPDLTVYLDVDSDTGLNRIKKGRASYELDRLDTESLQFHQLVRHAYLKLAEQNPDRIVTIDARDNLDTVVKKCFETIKNRFPQVF